MPASMQRACGDVMFMRSIKLQWQTGVKAPIAVAYAGRIVGPLLPITGIFDLISNSQRRTNTVIREAKVMKGAVAA